MVADIGNPLLKRCPFVKQPVRNDQAERACPGFRHAPTLTFATIFGFNPRIRFADIVETPSADRAAHQSLVSPEVNARQRVCALGRETVWR
jgi:hypothetical protein